MIAQPAFHASHHTFTMGLQSCQSGQRSTHREQMRHQIHRIQVADLEGAAEIFRQLTLNVPPALAVKQLPLGQRCPAHRIERRRQAPTVLQAIARDADVTYAAIGTADQI